MDGETGHPYEKKCPVCLGIGRTTGCAADLFRSHPIETVDITDATLREFWCETTGLMWWHVVVEPSATVRSGLHPTEAAARKAYSDARVAHARALAFPVAEAA